MYLKECVVNNVPGPHARPCAKIVEKTKELGVASETIFVRHAGARERFDVCLITRLMVIGAPFGTKLEVFSHDESLAASVDTLAELIENVQT
jgi:phosphotransferase system HPr-like phosphotransfer protein